MAQLWHVQTQGNRPKEELLSGECQALVALGDASNFEDFEAMLQGSRLVSQLSRLQSALNLPVKRCCGYTAPLFERATLSRNGLRPTADVHLETIICNSTTTWHNSS